VIRPFLSKGRSGMREEEGNIYERRKGEGASQPRDRFRLIEQ